MHKFRFYVNEQQCDVATTKNSTDSGVHVIRVL